MEIAFNAERGIQDAIRELSESESLTVVISYMVMFIYVAIALGSFRSFYTLLVCIDLIINNKIYRNFIALLLTGSVLFIQCRSIQNSCWHLVAL